MSSINADRDLCAGYGNCVMAADEYFDLHDDGTVRVLRPEVAAEDEAVVSDAVSACPVSALRLVT